MIARSEGIGKSEVATDHGSPGPGESDLDVGEYEPATRATRRSVWLIARTAAPRAKQRDGDGSTGSRFSHLMSANRDNPPRRR